MQPKTRKTFLGTLAAVALSGFLAPTLILAANPGIPHKFYGTVRFTSGATPNGLSVQAKINGVVVGSSATANGNYGYNPNLLFATDANSNNAGKTIEFYVSGIKANETATFGNGNSTELPLTVPGSVGTITKSAGESITEETVAISGSASLVVALGSALTLNISASSETTALIEKIELLPTSFFTDSATPPTGTSILNGYEIKLTGAGLSISAVMTYDDAGISESTIKPYRFTGTGWTAISPFTLNTVANTITFTVPVSATPYALFGEPTPPASSPVVVSVSGGGGGGGGGSASTPSPTKKGVASGDGKIDVFDFNTLMVNWGGGVGSKGDLDGNGKVDIFDFNILMVNWL
ncbi:MAG: hypothetical protein Q7J22_00345 [Candidatus Wolfebacteria bacterium]|nr:hypothetical protein [Candidatus Wolfebacteria bacterium]